jgi:hypothetical protein
MKTMPRLFARSLSLLVWLLAAVPVLASAWELQGSKTITAHTRDKQQITLGTVDFTPHGAGSVAFTVAMKPASFTDYFLSMKEFKCLNGAGEVVCHVPYPYQQPGTTTDSNFAWLEHNLLFLYKRPSEFGAVLWNGLYFHFTRTDQGLVGRPQAIDLNRISSPPNNLSVPPYGPELRDDIPPGAHWIDSITIE